MSSHGFIIPFGILSFGVYHEFVNALMFCYNHLYTFHEFNSGSFHYVIIFSNAQFHNLVAFCRDRGYEFLQFYCHLV